MLFFRVSNNITHRVRTHVCYSRHSKNIEAFLPELIYKSRISKNPDKINFLVNVNSDTFTLCLQVEFSLYLLGCQPLASKWIQFKSKSPDNINFSLRSTTSITKKNQFVNEFFSVLCARSNVCQVTY